MNNYVVFSDKYKQLVKPYSILLEKYWEGAKVIFLGYSLPDIELPNNHSIVSIDENMSKYTWSSGLLKYFNLCKDPYFSILLEDMLLIDYVNTDSIDLAINEIKVGADKIVLCQWWDRCDEYKEDMIKVRQASSFRGTLHPAIWKREYFIKNLKACSGSPWNFETNGSYINDKAEIFAFIQKPAKDRLRGIPYPINNLYRRGGKLIKKSINFMHQEDQEMLKTYLNLK